MDIYKKGKAHEAGESARALLDFNVIARRNKLLGLWLAGKMELAGDAADNYAKEVVLSDFEEPGDEDVIRKVMSDIANKSLEISEKDVRAKLGELASVARQQIQDSA